MFKQINLSGQYITPMVEIINRALQKVQQAPTPPKQAGYGILAYQQGNNPTALDLENKVLSVLSSVAHLPYQQTAPILDLMADLCLVTSALRAPNAQQQFGYQVVMELQKVKAGVANAVQDHVNQALRGPQQQPGGYNTQPTQYDPYAGQHQPQQSGGYQQQPARSTANDWVTGIPNGSQQHRNRFDASASSGIGFETIGGTEPEPTPAPAQSMSYVEPVQTDTSGSILDAFNQPAWNDDGIFDDIESTPSETLEDYTMDTPIQETPETNDSKISHEVINDISELQLFETHMSWLKRLCKDGNMPLGIVVISGGLFVPVSRMTRKSTNYRGYIAFNVVRDIRENKVTTDLIYISTKDLPMDYETLSPNPIVVHPPENIIKKPADLVEEEFAYHVSHETIACPDGMGVAAAAARCTSLLISVGNILSDRVKTRAKTAIFLAWEARTLAVVEATSIEEVELPEYDDDDTLMTIMSNIVGPTLKTRVKSELDNAVLDLLTKRYEFPPEALEWDDVVLAWTGLIEAVTANTDYGYDDVVEEFNRARDSVLKGSHYRVTPLEDYSESQPSWSSEDITSLSYTTPEEKTSYFAIEVMRPVADMGSWLTIEEMGLTKDERLSTSTHSVIAEPILAVFEKYPTLTQIDVYDVDGELTTVHRGLNKSRALVRT